MTHKQLYETFKLYFHMQRLEAVAWFPNGKNSIRIRTFNNKDYIFTYNNEDNWCLETAKSFLDHQKGANENV